MIPHISSSQQLLRGTNNLKFQRIYVANDPINVTDPTGEWIWVAVGAAIALQAGRRLTQGTATAANALSRAEGDFAASHVANSVVAPIVDNSATAVLVEAMPPS